MDAQAVTQALLTPDGRADPYPLYAEAHRLGPVSVISDGWYLVSGYAAASQLLRNPAFGPPGPQARTPGQPERPALALMGMSVLESSPPGHGRMRSVLSSAFTPRRVAALEPAIASAVETLLGRLAGAGEPADFMEQFAYLLPVTVICELLGVSHADRDWFRPLARDLTGALEPLAATPALDAADTAASELATYFTRLIAGRRAAPRDDLISALMAASDAADARLSGPELLANLILLLVAGFETTTDLLGNGTAIFLDRPQTAAALRSGTITVAGFADEVLRYESPVQLTTRIALLGGLAVHGTPVPRGSQAIVLLGAANRDPARYRRPDTFDPAREDSKPLSFGAGAHFCLGNSLARLEAAIAFPRILARFPRLAAAPSGRTRRARIALRGYHTLPVITGSSIVDRKSAEVEGLAVMAVRRRVRRTGRR